MCSTSARNRASMSAWSSAASRGSTRMRSGPVAVPRRSVPPEGRSSSGGGAAVPTADPSPLRSAATCGRVARAEASGGGVRIGMASGSGPRMNATFVPGQRSVPGSDVPLRAPPTMDRWHDRGTGVGGLAGRMERGDDRSTGKGRDSGRLGRSDGQLALATVHVRAFSPALAFRSGGGTRSRRRGPCGCRPARPGRPRSASAASGRGRRPCASRRRSRSPTRSRAAGPG